MPNFYLELSIKKRKATMGPSVKDGGTWQVNSPLVSYKPLDPSSLEAHKPGQSNSNSVWPPRPVRPP
jgi:hypothetical protein